MVDEDALFDAEACFRYQLDDNAKYWSHMSGRPRRVPVLERFFTVGVYTVPRKPG